MWLGLVLLMFLWFWVRYVTIFLNGKGVPFVSSSHPREKSSPSTTLQNFYPSLAVLDSCMEKVILWILLRATSDSVLFLAPQDLHKNAQQKCFCGLRSLPSKEKRPVLLGLLYLSQDRLWLKWAPARAFWVWMLKGEHISWEKVLPTFCSLSFG